MERIYTVGQVNTFIKKMFDEDILLRNISLKGEVSNYKKHSSGHIYFTLKDSIGSISCVMFASQAKLLSTVFKDGDKLVANGSISVYERDGKYQLYVRKVILEGMGNLYAQYEYLKQKLEKAGFFDTVNKQPIPKYAKTIGVVTSSTGAVIQDIIQIAGRRNPYVQIILYPAKVQGEGAEQSIVRGIETLDKREDIDVIIIGRGGGSIEDLWAFNEESVATAIFYANKPVISAVGHETDYTIADFVSDMRAPTPSAAAEITVFDYNDFIQQLYEYNYNINRILKQKVALYRSKITNFVRNINYLSPSNQITQKRQYTIDLENKLNEAIKKKMISKRHQLAIYAERFKGASPLHKLGKGFAYMTNEEKQVVTSIEHVDINEQITLKLIDGEIMAKVSDKVGLNNGSKNKNPRTKF